MRTAHLQLNLVKELENDQLFQLLEEANKVLKDRLTPKLAVAQPTPAKSFEIELSREYIIGQAKQSLNDLKQSGTSFYLVKSYSCKAEFHVNSKKRVVTVLLKGFRSCRVRAKGIAKCGPDDVFNSHIGKAIALHRALGLSIPKMFINTPQPKEVQIGDVVVPTSDPKRATYCVTSLAKHGGNCRIIDVGNGQNKNIIGDLAYGGSFGWAKIIDDSKDKE